MKKIIVSLLSLALLFSLTACGGDNSATIGDLVSSLTGDSDEIGGEDGYLGSTMKTAFFNFVVEDAYTCDSYMDYFPEEGNKLLVASLEIKNTMLETIPMWDIDFQAQWGDDEDEEAYSFPILPITDEQLPEEYEIQINGTASGLLIFEVPADAKDCSISFWEYFDDDSYGDVFFVYFTPEHVAGAGDKI